MDQLVLEVPQALEVRRHPTVEGIVTHFTTYSLKYTTSQSTTLHTHTGSPGPPGPPGKPGFPCKEQQLP